MYPLMINVAVGKCRDRETAQDHVQDTFLKLWTCWIRHGDREIWTKPYCIQTLNNVIIDSWRKQQRRPMTGGELLDQPSVEDSHDGEMPLSARVQKALDELRCRQRQVITKVVLEGLSVDETAEVLKLSRETVRSYRRIALLRLRDILSGSPE